MNVPYIPGSAPPPELPLGRFLPPLPMGMVSKWCQENLDSGDWVLDPFGFNPMVPIEIVKAGHPVLVTVNNPIHAFLLYIFASAPQEQELIAALHDLAVASKGKDRMEPYIRSLYLVQCVDCRSEIEADGFLWQKGAAYPYASLIKCTHCGAEGEQQLSEQVLKNLTPIPPKHLHHARALNRVVDRNDPFRGQVENALNAYPARPLIVLQTMINKLETLEQTPRRRELLIALILSAADQGNTLWAYPSPRNRPRQIVIPSVYKERNLWKVLEDAIKTWQVIETPVSLSDWTGDFGQAAGIFRFQGRIKELSPKPKGHFFSAVLTAFPRPNQAFWTLSALWTGWVWGPDSVAPIRQVLSRQRYDWNWHTNALKGVFESIQVLGQPLLKCWGLIAENEPMLLLATLLAADSKGFRLDKYAQSMDDQLAQCYWVGEGQPPAASNSEQVKDLARKKIIDYLRQNGEPAQYQQIHAAIITGLASDRNLAAQHGLDNPHQPASSTQNWIVKIFQEKPLLTRFDSSAVSLETGQWWLTRPQDVAQPLADRVEETIRHHLVHVEITSSQVVKEIVYRTFPGIFTPDVALLYNCLDSYADLVEADAHRWKLCDSEKPANRREDIHAIRNTLAQIAQRLDYQVTGDAPMLWFKKNSPLASYSLYVVSSAVISKQIYQNPHSAQIKLIILPGSRANLLAFKKQRNPLLKEKLDQDFLVVKFRLIRDLYANPLLSVELFKEQIRTDPPEYRSSQLALF